jgi:hypothetical protein
LGKQRKGTRLEAKRSGEKEIPPASKFLPSVSVLKNMLVLFFAFFLWISERQVA